MSEEMIVHNCSPTLAGLKTANLFSCSFDSEREMTASLRRWNEALSGKGICMLPLRKSAKRALVYVYRPGRLTRDLLDPKSQEILRTNGYTCKNTNSCLKELIRRLKTQEDFPHEIGLFLGYPPEDVRLFMSRQKKLVNKTNIPEHEIEKIARCFYPDIVRDFMNEEIQREFAQWQAEQAANRAMLKLHKTNKGATVSALASVVIYCALASSVLWALILGVSGNHWENRHFHIL